MKLIFTALLYLVSTLALGNQGYEVRMRILLEEISEDAKLTGGNTGRFEFSSKVYNALSKVPRHKFVSSDFESQAYKNRPLPIGWGQTISQPYIVALMTDILDLDSDFKVLEIGTGSGYQAAVLSHLVKEVYSIEIIPELAEIAQERLKKLEYNNINVIKGDGYNGYKNKAPFDCIIVTAAASHIPPELISQLKTGGKLIIPIGTPFQVQYLILVDKLGPKEISQRNILPVQFVPFTGSINEAQK